MPGTVLKRDTASGAILGWLEPYLLGTTKQTKQLTCQFLQGTESVSVLEIG